jgi:Fe-S oxidoreductase
VAPERLPEFAARFREIFHRHGTDGAFYGHASVGCLHIRPVLNLHDPNDVVTMRRIMEEVTDLVLAFNGSLSGEHGDGLVRSEWNRKMFGPVVYEAFRQVKRGFDPENLLNPGKIIDAPAMEVNWRVSPGHLPPEPSTIFDYSRQRGFFQSIENCNGAGVCRKTQGGAMCPSYRATRDERDTTRARANALRLSLVNSRQSFVKTVDSSANDQGLMTNGSSEPLAQRWIAEVMDLCLSCKACKTECPSNVDLAKLKAEWLCAFYEHRMRPIGHLLVKNIHRLSPLAARFAGMNNWFARRPFVRRMMESFTGIDRRRRLPEWHREHFRKWFARRASGGRQPPVGASNKGLTPPARRVILLDDCFTTFQEPRIGRAAITLLERAGFQVELAGVCCGRAMISKGFLTDARRLARAGIARLDAHASAGVPILGLEPSCILTLADEWPELVPGAAAKRVAAAAELAEAWIGRQIQEGALAMTFPAAPGKVLFHAHCHQKALVGPRGSADALRLVPDLSVEVLDAGCCGMAGSFGYEKAHYDVSVKIANLALVPAVNADTTATVVATGTSCRHQIRDLTGREALHPLEVLAGPC